jgi:hypothetical protein
MLNIFENSEGYTGVIINLWMVSKEEQRREAGRGRLGLGLGLGLIG